MGSFAHHGRLTFPILLDPSLKVAARYGVVSLPVSYFIDQDGIVRKRVFGGTLTKGSINEAFLQPAPPNLAGSTAPDGSSDMHNMEM